jgi:hypothetical protein
MTADWTALLARWTNGGLIDDATAARIRAFEQEHAGAARLRWPILVAWGVRDGRSERANMGAAMTPLELR